jgi:hypothetical protein
VLHTDPDTIAYAYTIAYTNLYTESLRHGTAGRLHAISYADNYASGGRGTLNLFRQIW